MRYYAILYYAVVGPRLVGLQGARVGGGFPAVAAVPGKVSFLGNQFFGSLHVLWGKVISLVAKGNPFQREIPSTGKSLTGENPGCKPRASGGASRP